MAKALGISAVTCSTLRENLHSCQHIVFVTFYLKIQKGMGFALYDDN